MPAGSGGFDWRTLVSAISSLAETHAKDRADRRALDELDRGQAEIQGIQQGVDRRIGDEVTAMQTSGPEPERQRAAAQYTAAVRKARTQGNASEPSTLGGARYRADVAQRAGEGVGYANRVADQFARIDAPGLQRLHEGERRTAIGGDIRVAQSKATTAEYLARLRAENARRVSPWALMLSRLGTQIANNYEPGGGQAPGDGLEPIDMSTLPERMATPRRIPKLRQMPTWE